MITHLNVYVTIVRERIWPNEQKYIHPKDGAQVIYCLVLGCRMASAFWSTLVWRAIQYCCSDLPHHVGLIETMFQNESFPLILFFFKCTHRNTKVNHTKKCLPVWIITPKQTSLAEELIEPIAHNSLNGKEYLKLQSCVIFGFITE